MKSNTNPLKVVWCLFGILAFCSISAAQTAKHPFNTSDWASLRAAGAAAVSPDGSTILCHAGWGGESGPGTDEWRLINKDGSNPRKIELPEHFNPAGFMPGGLSLYGPYQVNGHAQLAVFTIAGINHSSTPSALVLLPRGIQFAVISPDGKRFAVVASTDPPDDLERVRTVVEPEHIGLYVVNVDGTGSAWWSKGFQNANTNASASKTNDIGAIAWSADSSSIAILSQTPKIGFHYVHSFIDVCTATGTRRVAEVQNAGSGIAWGDGGKELVFLSTTTSVLTPDHVWSVSVSGGTPSDRTPDLKGSAVGLAGDPHGNVWVSVSRGVRGEVDSYQNGALKPVFQWPEGNVAGTPVFSPLAASLTQLALNIGDPLHSANVAVPEGEGSLRRITTDGDDQLANTELGPVRVVHWTSKEGINIEGIATFPAGYIEGRHYPFLVLPHGGPESNDTLDFDAFSRLIAGLGYVVLQPEYRGSTGYGTEFLDAIYQHFGDRAYHDVDSATDYAIEQGWADPNRLAIFGWSAGGFMTSWTVTQTGRYKAAIEGAGITDWAPFMWTSDVQQIDYDQRWAEKDVTAFLQYSAVMYASKVTTPLLILHGEADLRVPTFQGREYYEALLANGKTTRLVTYPGSPHFPRLWEQRRNVFDEISSWLQKYNP